MLNIKFTCVKIVGITCDFDIRKKSQQNIREGLKYTAEPQKTP